MKKFLEELAKTETHLYDALPTNTEASRKRKELQRAYSLLVGKRALHVSKAEKSSRVVTIVEAGRFYVRVKYKYFGMDYQGEISSCVSYLSLLCGDDRLDVE